MALLDSSHRIFLPGRPSTLTHLHLGFLLSRDIWGTATGANLVLLVLRYNILDEGRWWHTSRRTTCHVLSNLLLRSGLW